MFAINKNSYLQSRSSAVPPEIINRSVTLGELLGAAACRQPLVADVFDKTPPFFRLTSHQPDIPIENVDVTRRPLAFGRLALPKLRRELHHKDPGVVLQALASLSDLVHDPERGYEALRLKIPDRLADLLLDPLSPIRENAVLVLSILAGLEEGKNAIVGNFNILENLALCLGDGQPSVRLKTAACFELLSRSWMVADVLVEWGLIPLVLDYVSRGDREEILIVHLETLKCLMYGCGKCVALKNHAFKILVQFLNESKIEITQKALDCLMLLTSTRQGKKLALEKQLLKTLNRLLHYGNPTIYTNVVSVIMFCTVKTQAKNVAAEIPTLVGRLVHLATNPTNAALQKFSLKALTNICEHPQVRKEISQKYFQEINGLQVGPDNLEHKKVLLRALMWCPRLST